MIKFFKKFFQKKKEKTAICNETEMLFQEYKKIFNSNRFTGYLSEDNPTWESYTNQRKFWAMYRPSRATYESGKVTEETVNKYINELIKLRNDIEMNDMEILALSAMLDEIDYSFACGMMVYPSPVVMIENRLLEATDSKVLVGIVNSLVRWYKVDPFKTEDKLKVLYKKIRTINISLQYSASKVA